MKNMELQPIKNEEEYDRMLEWIDRQFDEKTHPDSPAGDTLQEALLIVKAYEDEHYQIPPQVS